MYFAILWKNKEISRTELEYIQPTNIKEINNITITFDTEYEHLLASLWGVIKRGKIVAQHELEPFCKDKKICGVATKELGLFCKQELGIRRFKLVEPIHTDKEIKEKGIEFIKIGRDYGVVLGYQPIQLYEVIDFKKPARDMRKGMMPAKLTHIMLNIWVAKMLQDASEKLWDIVVYDPFVWSGTTGFLANTYGYDFLGSDKDINDIKKNTPRWLNSKYANKDKIFTVFQQDITQAIDDQDFKKDITQGLLVVSEWRLGPMVTKKTSEKEVETFQRKVLFLYKEFLHRMSERKKETSDFMSVITIPRYIGHQNIIEEELRDEAGKIDLTIRTVSELYQREDQLVARKILIIS